MFASGVHIVTCRAHGEPLSSRIFISEDTDFDGCMRDDSWYFWSFFTTDCVGYILYKFIFWVSIPDRSFVIELVGDGMELALREFSECVSDFSLHRSDTSESIRTEEVCPFHFTFFETEFAEIPRRERGVVAVRYLDTRADSVERGEDVFLIVCIVLFVDDFCRQTYVFVIKFLLEEFLSFFEPGFEFFDISIIEGNRSRTSRDGIICVTSLDISDTDYVIMIVNDLDELDKSISLSFIDIYTRMSSRESRYTDFDCFTFFSSFLWFIATGDEERPSATYTYAF